MTQPQLFMSADPGGQCAGGTLPDDLTVIRQLEGLVDPFEAAVQRPDCFRGHALPGPMRQILSAFGVSRGSCDCP